MNSLVRRRLFRWGLFGIVTALLPIIFTFLGLLGSKDGLSLGALLGEGELLLIAVALYGPTLGEVITMPEEWEDYKLWIGAFCFLNSAVASWYFATASDKPASYVATTSLVLFCIAVACSDCNVYVAARRERRNVRE